MGAYISYSAVNTNNNKQRRDSTSDSQSNSSRKLSSIEIELEDNSEVYLPSVDFRMSSLHRQNSKRKSVGESTTLNLDFLINTEQLCSTVKQYEIDFDNLEIENNLVSKFSTGFGRIIRNGTIRNLYFTNEPTSVLIKQCDNDTSTNVDYNWKSFLKEINLLAWVGWHEHIVTFLGVSVGDLNKRELFMICEHSKNGNLRDYLRCRPKRKENVHQVHEVQITDCSSSSSSSCSSSISSTTPLSNNNYKLQDDDDIESLTVLLKWICQICSAMEFLESRRVVLVELTASSIHLTENLTVKLGDFTLARSLKSDEDYFILNDQVPLPWRWLAPESFEQFKFSSETDVWAFAVVIWEIFSYGQQPFAGLNWTNVFVENLKDGIRLPRLSNTSIELYNFMESCWDLSPELRPNFNFALKFLSTLQL